MTGTADPTDTAPNGDQDRITTTAAQRRRVRWYYRRDRLRHPLIWWRERCAACGRRPFWTESMILMPGSGSFHDACHAAQHWRRVACERLDVLAVVAETWEIDGGTVQELMALRARANLADEANAKNVGWRVFYDLDNLRKREAQDA